MEDGCAAARWLEWNGVDGLMAISRHCGPICWDFCLIFLWLALDSVKKTDKYRSGSALWQNRWDDENAGRTHPVHFFCHVSCLLGYRRDTAARFFCCAVAPSKFRTIRVGCDVWVKLEPSDVAYCLHFTSFVPQLEMWWQLVNGVLVCTSLFSLTATDKFTFRNLTKPSIQNSTVDQNRSRRHRGLRHRIRPSPQRPHHH